MKLLFVAYCMIRNENGDSLIGVYKRCLRIGLELHSRGHNVSVLCTGRHAYQDPTVEKASVLTFIDPPGRIFFLPDALRRRYLRKLIHRERFDRIVIGEAPLGGVLLDATLIASDLRVPVFMLDNAYGPGLARLFLRMHGALFDGLLLTGPSSFHPRQAPKWYCALPPLVSEEDGASATAELQRLRLEPGRYIAVMGYERKAELLALNLLRSGTMEEYAFLLISPNPDETRERLAELPAHQQALCQVISGPPESLLFVLLRHAAVAVGKCGFMQVSECFSLGTPFVAIFYRGCFPPDLLSAHAQRFLHTTTITEATPQVIGAVLRLAKLPREQLASLHDGHFDALARSAAFLETRPLQPRRGATVEASRAGYSRAFLKEAVQVLHAGRRIRVESVRCSRLRNLPEGQVDALAVHYTVDRSSRFASLWGAVLKDAATAAATAPGENDARRRLFRSPCGRIVIEKDAGNVTCLRRTNVYTVVLPRHKSMQGDSTCEALR